MNCKFNWYDLPNEIKLRIAEPIKELISVDLYNQFMNLNWFNLPIKLNNIFKKVLIEKPDCTDVPYSKFIWFSLDRKVNIFCQIKDSILNCNGINFDFISSDWGDITDKESFRLYLELINSDTGLVTVEEFTLIEGRLKCKLGGVEAIELSNRNITDIVTCNVNGLKQLILQNNNITIFNPIKSLSAGLKQLDLSLNPLTYFNPSIELPTTLLDLFLTSTFLNNEGFITSEEWATKQTLFIDTCSIYVNNTINDITGTNLEAILLTKNCTILA